MNTVLAVLAVIGMASVGVVLAEVRDLTGWLAPKVLKAAARRVPARSRAVREEEWLAHLGDLEGLKLLKLVWAVSTYCVAATRIRWQHRDEMRLERQRGALLAGAGAYTWAVVSRPTAAPAPVRVLGWSGAGLLTLMTGYLTWGGVAQTVTPPGYFIFGWRHLEAMLQLYGYGAQAKWSALSAVVLLLLMSAFTRGFRRGPRWAVWSSAAVGSAGCVAGAAPIVFCAAVVVANALAWLMIGVLFVAFLIMCVRSEAGRDCACSRRCRCRKYRDGKGRSRR